MSLRVANLFILSMILPACTYAYVRLEGINPISSLPIEPILAAPLAFYFFYGAAMIYAEGRVDLFFPRIRPVLALSREQFAEYEQTCRDYLYQPSRLLLVFVLLLTLIGYYFLANSTVLHGDSVFMSLLFMMLLFSSLFNWIGGWALISFHHLATQFEEAVVDVNPFNPDRMGGLEPISELITFGIGIVGLLAALIIPFWYVFSTAIAVSLAALVTAVIPLYLYFSIYRIHTTLKRVKQEALSMLAPELVSVNDQISSLLGKGKLMKLNRTRLIRISENLEAVQRIYDSVNSMHTYPIDAQTILKVVSTMSVPILSVVLTRFAENLWSILT